MNSNLQNKHIRRSEPHFWNADIEEATGRAFNWQCPFCGIDLQNNQYHKSHVYPVGSGMGVVPGNIILTCVKCNLDMGDTPMWQWCNRSNFQYGHIQMTLDVLSRIFLPSGIQIGVSVGEYKPRQPRCSKARTLVQEYLEANPDAISMKVRELADIIGVGKTTVSDVIKGIKADKEAGQSDG